MTHKQKTMNLWSAVAMGVGSMVGAGIFALLGEAAAIAGTATYLSFVVGGLVALLAGYSYAKLGVRYPSSGGVVEYLVQGFGPGLFSGGLALLFYFASVIGMAMVAKAFGSYATGLFVGEGAPYFWVNLFSSGLVILLTQINFIGADAVGKSEKLIVFLKLAVLVSFVFLGLFSFDPGFLSPASYPPTGALLVSISLTFFAFTGFGVIANTVEEMPDPARTLPRAIYLAIVLVLLLYLALSLAVFGNLPVEQIVADKETALAEAARPVLGQIGFVIMAAAALLSTASSINANLYGSLNITYTLAKHGELPASFGRRLWHEGTEGLVITAGLVLLLANLLDLEAIAGLGSASFLLVYLSIQVAHLRLADQTGGSRPVILVGTLATGAILVLFLENAASEDPQTLILFAIFSVLSFTIEYVLQKTRGRTINPKIQ